MAFVSLRPIAIPTAPEPKPVSKSPYRARPGETDSIIIARPASTNVLVVISAKLDPTSDSAIGEASDIRRALAHKAKRKRVATPAVVDQAISSTRPTLHPCQAPSRKTTTLGGRLRSSR